MVRGRSSQWVQVDAPDWLWGGKMRRYFEEAGYHLRSAGSTEHVLIRTSEGYRNTRPNLVRLIRALGPGATANGLRELSGLADDSVESRSSASIEEALTRWGNGPEGLTEMASYYQLATLGVSSSDLPQQAKNVWDSIREVTFTDERTQAFPHAGVYAVARTDQLALRMKLMSILLRVQHDASVAGGDIAAIKAAHDAGSVLIFAAGQELHSGHYLLDPYVSALLGSTSPGVWGFLSFRGRGPVLYSFGQQVSGTNDRASDLLRTLHVPGADSATEFDRWDGGVVPDALAWWVSSLNELFGVLTDCAVFSGPDGRYLPSKQLEAVATVEQLFRRVLSIQTSFNDANARRVLLFTVLDTLESLTGRPIEKHCEHRYASKTLETLKELVPVGAQPLLLSGAARAVDALQAVQGGFFLPEADGRVLVQPSTGRTASKDEAAAQYLKVLRDATHGHGSTKKSRAELTETLLAKHDGRVPHDVPMLGWLYLVHLLAQPQVLRASLEAQSRRSYTGSR